MESLVQLAPGVAMIALLWKIVDFLKYCTNWSSGGKNPAVTQLVVWFGGIVAVFLFARTDWAASITVSGLTLDKMNLWSQLAAGLSAGALTSVGFDIKKALDRSDSAKTPPLMDGVEVAAPPPPVVDGPVL